MDWLGAALLGLVFFAGLSIVLGTARAGISPMPSTPTQVEGVLAALPAGFSGVVYELGAGWGSLAFAIARRFPRARVVAFELSWVPFAFLWLRAAWGPRNVALRREDF